MYFCSKIYEKKDNFILHLIHELSALNHKKKIAQKTEPTKNIKKINPDTLSAISHPAA